MPRAINQELLDAGKRVSDYINLMLVSHNPWEIKDKWMAFALSDGESRGELFDTILDAKRFTDEFKTWYVCLAGVLSGTNPRDCAIMLQFHREARDAGLGQKNPQDNPFMSTEQADAMKRRVAPILWTPN